MEREQVYQLLKRAKEIIDKSKNPTALNFYRLAEKQLQKTHSISNEKNYSLESENYQKATRLLIRAIDITKNTKKYLDNNVYNELATLDDMIESIRNKIELYNFQDNKRVMFLSNQIINLQNDAHNALDNKDYKTAKFHAQMAQKLVERALQILNKKSNYQTVDRLKDEMGQLEINLNSIEKKVNNTKNKEAQVLIKLANKAKNNAQRFLERGNHRLTIGAIAVANKFAFTAERLILANNVIQINNDELIIRIQNNQEIINQLNSKNILLTNRDKMFLREAKKRMLQTNDNFNKGFFVVTNECLDIVERILSRIENK